MMNLPASDIGPSTEVIRSRQPFPHELVSILKTASRRISFWVGVALFSFAVVVWARPSLSIWTIQSNRFFLGYGFWSFFAYMAFVCTTSSFPTGGRLLVRCAMMLGAVGGIAAFIPSIHPVASICWPMAIVALVGGACSYLPRFRVLALSVAFPSVIAAFALVHLLSEVKPKHSPNVGRNWPVIDPDKMPVRAVGSAAPDFEANDLHGEKMTLSEYRGKVVLLVFWASWCQPCLADVPHERELVERFANRPFKIIGVNVDDSTVQALSAVKQHSIPWRSFWNGGAGGPITDQWGIQQFPTVYLIDDEGVIRHKDLRGVELDVPLEQMTTMAEKRANKLDTANAQ